jgi:hypothetical protein
MCPATFGRLSRTELAMTVYEHPGWYSATGSPKVDAGMKLLEKIESQGVSSPSQKHAVLPCARKIPYPTERTEREPEMECNLADLALVFEKRAPSLDIQCATHEMQLQASKKDHVSREGANPPNHRFREQ